MSTLATIERTNPAPLPSPFATDEIKKLADYHTHTEASPDSKENIFNVCSAAVKAGLSEICITDHYDCGYKECRQVIAASYASIERAALEFEPVLKVKRGAEVGEATQNHDDERHLLDNYKFDCLLGSMHNIRGNVDFYFMDALPDPEGMLRMYFEELIEMCETCDFDVLAHLTYPMRYKGFLGIKDLSLFDKEISRILRLVADTGRALEINTGGVRNHDYRLTDPWPEFVRLYKSFGGEMITFGSDAHTADVVAADFNAAVDIAKAAGFTHYTVYNDRKPKLVEF